MTHQFPTVIVLALISISARTEVRGYIKSFAVLQDRIDTPVIQADPLFQSQTSARLMWQKPGDNISWQVHYELSALLNSTRVGFDNATFAESTNSYRLSDPESRLNGRNDKHQMFQNLDRINVRLTFDYGDLTIGRQALSHGAARIINPIDVFLPFDVRTFDQEYRIGVDAVRFQYPIGQLGEIDTGIILGDGARSENSAAFAGIRNNINGNDLQLYLIRFAEQNLVGGGLQTSLWRHGAWIEAARVSGDRSYWRVSAGVDHTFTENIFGLIEYHYNGAGTNKPERYLQNAETLPYRQGGVFLLGENYLIPALNWQISPLWRLGLQSIYNLNDQSVFLSATAQYNVAENFYVDFGYYFFSGDELSEDQTGMPVLESEYGTNPATMFTSLKYYF